MKDIKQSGPIPDHILDLLTRHALGRLQGSDLQILEHWMDQNPGKLDECETYMDQVKKYYWLYLSEPIKDPETVVDELLQKQEPTSKARKLALKLIPYAATLLIMLAFAWYLFQLSSDTEPTEIQAEASTLERHNKAVLVLSDGKSLVLDSFSGEDTFDENGVRITNQPGEILRYEQEAEIGNATRLNRLIVPAGARYQLQLADGTKVWMNSQSELEYPVTFSSSSRRVKLNGEAFFEVFSNSSAPFIIEANGYEIMVLGTAFNVSAYHDDGFIQTTLVSGALEMSNREGLAYKLNPGQMAMVDHQSQNFEIEYVDTRLFTSWKDGVLHFNKIALIDLATKLERWYDVDISFTNQKTAGYLFSGAMENSREIRFLLDLIGRAANVEFEINEKQIIVK